MNRSIVLLVASCSFACRQDSRESLILEAAGDRNLAYQSLRAQLPPMERWRTSVEGRHAVVDLQGTGGSSILMLLRKIKAEVHHPVVVDVMEPGEPFDCLVSEETQGNVALRDFREKYQVRNYVRVHPEGAFGQTCLPLTLPLVTDRLFALGPRFEVYLAKDQPLAELAGTYAHELFHVAFGPGHPPELLAVEDEARENARK